VVELANGELQEDRDDGLLAIGGLAKADEPVPVPVQLAVLVVQGAEEGQRVQAPVVVVLLELGKHAELLRPMVLQLDADDLEVLVDVAVHGLGRDPDHAGRVRLHGNEDGARRWFHCSRDRRREGVKELK
jgi:hypothetical protein